MHRGDARARHAAQRARDPGRRAQRARERRVHRQERPDRGDADQRRARDAEVARRGSSAAVMRSSPCVTRGPASRRRCLRARTRDASVGRDPRPSAPSRRAASSAKYERTGQRSSSRRSRKCRIGRDLVGVDRRDVPRRDRVGRDGDRRRRAARVRGSDRATTIVPAARSPSRWSCSVATIEIDADRGRRPAGSRRCARCCGPRSPGSGSARPLGPTTRMPAASLPIVRPLFSVSNATS